MPSLNALAEELPALIKGAAKHFTNPVVTEVKYSKA
jgi:hypothetical protein